MKFVVTSLGVSNLSSDCKGICHLFPNACFNNRLRYAEGMVFCRKCNRVFRDDLIKCECCKNRVSHRSRQCR